ncbi:hypothetical protein [Streptomyces sp. XD-27]|uniref:hypothetical protein n=1 Tax=Streptomyces sp. XD-27 TaxID=3062779 RepID=UPI0026F42D90|nr:hypothetical protein [Streptomyces sp. XD-27]WKX71354.1 hypothetical protein Q3Y56_16885 [Streptomyces sp. XD-27]
MAIYAEVEKVYESDQEVRYKFMGAEGVERVVVLDKMARRTRFDGGVEHNQYLAVASKVAVTWGRDGVAPDRLIVAS